MKKTIVVILGVIVLVALALVIIPTTKCEQLAWAEAQATNTIRSYQAYISAYPQGMFVQQAKTKISALRSDNAPFDAACRTGTEASLKQFLKDFPGHQKEKDAQQVLKDITKGCDIVDALRERKIEVKVEGSGIESVQVHIRRRVPYKLTVHIPVGTYFVSGKASVQNMVTTEKSEVELTTDEWKSVSVSAACANMRLDVPESGDTFTVQRSPEQADLVKLMPVLERAKVDWATKQAAVWIVTDDADYGDLGILTASPFGIDIARRRVINEQEAARAMQLCDEAGIDITRKAIWEDRQRIISGLEDDTLKKWLMERK